MASNNEDYFDASQINIKAFEIHFSERRSAPPDVADTLNIQFIRICGVGNTIDPDKKSLAVYYIEVKNKSASSISQSQSSFLRPSWFVYRSYSQFKELRFVI